MDIYRTSIEPASRLHRSYTKATPKHRGNAYQDFASLANRLPVVYVERILMEHASFLMPGIPVSDGTLPTLEQELGEMTKVDGQLALVGKEFAEEMKGWALVRVIDDRCSTFLHYKDEKNGNVTWKMKKKGLFEEILQKYY